MRLNAWTLDGNVLVSTLDDDYTFGEEYEEIRVTLFNGDECVIDDKYWIDASLSVGASDIISVRAEIVKTPRLF